MPCAENVQAMRETKGARGGGGAEAEGRGRAEVERHDTGEKGSGGGTRWQGHNDGGRLRRHCNGGRIWEWIWHQRRGCSGRFESWMWPGHWRRGSFFHRWLPRPLPRALHQSDVSSNCASSSFGTGIMMLLGIKTHLGKSKATRTSCPSRLYRFFARSDWGTEMDPSAAAAAAALPSYVRAVDAYRKAVGTAASVTAYVVLARGMARELLPHDLRAAASWIASLIRARLEPLPPERRTVVIKRLEGSRHLDGGDNGLYGEVHEYLATRIDPHSMRRICLSGGGSGAAGDRKVMSMEHGDSMTDVFEGVEFTWSSVAVESQNGNGYGTESLELSFDAEHTDMALEKYIPFITAAAEEARRGHSALEIFMNEGSMWNGITHHHPATFDTLAMDPALKQSVVADLDRFLGRREYYRRIGKAWKRGYLLYGPPGTGKSSLVAAMANYLRFNLYDLDLSVVYSNSALQRLLIGMPNKSIFVIEDIDCCFSTASREEEKEDDSHYERRITLSGLLNFIDGLWSTSGEERIIIFTTNFKDRLDSALLQPGRMDMHIYMGYCGWDAFKTLARNYHLVDGHALFLEIQELLSGVEVTPAEVSEMLLRSEDVDVALRVLAEFLREKKQAMSEGN